MGLGMIAAARQKSPKCLIALDLFDWKLDLAIKCGADLAFNPTKCNLKQEIDKVSDNYGCDVYIEVKANFVSKNCPKRA